MDKFYILEDITQEDLNKLSLERNILENKFNKLNKEFNLSIDEADRLFEENKELKEKVDYYENFEINKTVDKIRMENNKKTKKMYEAIDNLEKDNILIKSANKLLNDKLNKIKKIIEDIDYEDIHDLIESCNKIDKLLKENLLKNN